MKSQIRCESKHNWMKKREIPAAKRNKDRRDDNRHFVYHTSGCGYEVGARLLVL